MPLKIEITGSCQEIILLLLVNKYVYDGFQSEGATLTQSLFTSAIRG